MAEWLSRLTINQIGFSCASSNIAVRHFSLTSSHHILPSDSPKQWKEVIPWEREKSNRTVPETMTDTEKNRYSEMQSWRSAEGVWLEITWVLPSQILNLFTLIFFRSTLLNASNYQKLPIIDFYVIHPETKNSHSSSTNIDRRIKVKTLSW